jgi:hypothetical protein
MVVGSALDFIFIVSQLTTILTNTLKSIKHYNQTQALWILSLISCFWSELVLIPRPRLVFFFVSLGFYFWAWAQGRAPAKTARAQPRSRSRSSTVAAPSRAPSPRSRPLPRHRSRLRAQSAPPPPDTREVASPRTGGAGTKPTAGQNPDCPAAIVSSWPPSDNCFILFFIFYY